MRKYTVEISSKARKELLVHYKSGNKSVIRRIEQIFLELSNTPYEGIGSPEALKYNMAGYWSRRIDKKTGSSIRSMKLKLLSWWYQPLAITRINEPIL